MFGKEIDSLATLRSSKTDAGPYHQPSLLADPSGLFDEQGFLRIYRIKGVDVIPEVWKCTYDPLHLRKLLVFIKNAIFENFKSSFAYGKLALELIQKFGKPEFVPATKFIVGTFLNPTQRHLRTSIDILQTGYEMGTSTGDFINAVFCQGMMVTDKYLTACNIDEMWPEVLECIDYVSKIKSHNADTSSIRLNR